MQVPFDSNRIKAAIMKCLECSHDVGKADIQSKAAYIADLVTQELYDGINLEDIQNIVERHLLNDGLRTAAKNYMQYRDRRTILRKSTVNTKNFFSTYLGIITYIRSYARWLKDEGCRETWPITVARYMDFMRENMGNKLSEEEYAEIHDAILTFKVMPSMRLMQFAGPAARRCNVCIYNCAYVAPKSLKEIVEIMYISMCGTGVGWSVESANISQLPVIAHQLNVSKTLFVIPDNKEGWCDALYAGLEAWYTGKDVVYDYSLLRPFGARLVTMGGRASGPGPLKELLGYARNRILQKQGQQLSTLDVYDIICKIGEIVVSGGVRRTANISLSDLDDVKIRDAKSAGFWHENSHRSIANNSTVYTSKPQASDFIQEFLALIKNGAGERGIFNRGGLVDVIPKRRVELLGEAIHGLGPNPCCEILLQDGQFCNLSEVICHGKDTLEDLRTKIRIATVIGTYQATLCNFNYISDKWRRNQEMERLLGVSLTNMWGCSTVRDAENLRCLRDYAIEVNKEYAHRFGINPSTAITCVKPSGTVSTMLGVSSGIHKPFAKYYIRRIRMSRSDPLFNLLRDQGMKAYPETGTNVDNATTYVFEFPVKMPDAEEGSEMSAIQQLEFWKLVKENFTEHNPSVTIYVKDHEWVGVMAWVWDNWKYITGISFFPYRDNIYPLAPYEKITAEEYEQRLEDLPDVDFTKLVYYEVDDNTDFKRQAACMGGQCDL